MRLLEFDKDSLQKIQSKKWHIKAKGIQELAIMEQVQYVKEIFDLQIIQMSWCEMKPNVLL